MLVESANVAVSALGAAKAADSGLETELAPAASEGAPVPVAEGARVDREQASLPSASGKKARSSELRSAMPSVSAISHPGGSLEEHLPLYRGQRVFGSSGHGARFPVTEIRFHVE